jgi:organic radical activating enzyme
MYIADKVYSLQSKSYEVYLNGCKPKFINGRYQHCPGCHNSHLFDFLETDNREEEYRKIKSTISFFNSMIDFIWILGGEPLDQKEEELKDLISFLKQFNKTIILFTGYDISKYKEFNYDVDYVKYGYFDYKNKNKIYFPELKLELIGDNQRVYDVKNDVELIFIEKEKED